MAGKSLYRRFLDEQIEIIFDNTINKGWGYNRVADEAGIAVSTVWNLFRGVTQEPRLSTLWKLGDAVGMDVKLAKQSLAKLRKAG